jgi:hypothetical protein
MSEKLWIYDLNDLFKSFQLIPKEKDSYYTKLNTIVRLTIVLGLVLSCWKPGLGVGIVLVVAMITVIVDAGYTKTTNRENFEETECKSRCKVNKYTYPMNRAATEGGSHNGKLHLTSFVDKTCGNINLNFPMTQLRFCNDEVPLTFDNTYKSPNNIGGPANPKTFITPIIAAPAFDLDSWKTNGFVTHSAINESRNYDVERTGYNYGVLPTKCKNCSMLPCGCNRAAVAGKAGNTFGATGSVQNKSLISLPNNMLIENFEQPEETTPNYQLMNHIQDLQKSGVDIGNRQLVRRNVQSKFGTVQDKDIDQVLQTVLSNPKTDENFYFESKRRDALLTNTLVPGVYQKTHIAEPIQSNIGISYVQDWGPVEVEDTQFGIKFTEQDPKNVVKTISTQERVVEQDISNVYDPRLTGYGTSYRGYTDNVTGQPSFFYKDVESITQPNFITRHNLDVFPWATTYGPDVPVPHLDEYKQLANNSFVDSTILFRTEMMERLMRKKNAENWQRRAMPLSTMNKMSGMRTAV